jgi:hypothetical protein
VKCLVNLSLMATAETVPMTFLLVIHAVAVRQHVTC